MPAVTEDATGAGAGVRKPAGKEPAGGGVVAALRSLWGFGDLVFGGGRCGCAGWAFVLGNGGLQKVAGVRFGVGGGCAEAGSGGDWERGVEGVRGPPR